MRTVAGSLLLSLILSQMVAAGQVASLDELNSLPRSQALEARPFRLRGVVLCYDAGWNQFFLQTTGGTVYLKPDGIRTASGVGQSVEVTATTTWADNHPALTNLSVA